MKRSVTVACCHAFGDPREVVKVETQDLDDEQLGPEQVLVEMLVAPINPADINIIQGRQYFTVNIFKIISYKLGY